MKVDFPFIDHIFSGFRPDVPYFDHWRNGTGGNFYAVLLLVHFVSVSHMPLVI